MGVAADDFKEASARLLRTEWGDPQQLAEELYALLNSLSDESTSSSSSSTSTETNWTQELSVVEVLDDYLKCLPVGDEDDPDADYIYVAKPYSLRVSPFNGETIDSVKYTYSNSQTRVATRTDYDDETHQVVPSYEADDVIYAVRVKSGVDGVSDDDGDELKWVDLNVDARSWVRTA